jgi:hypothetical protein
MFEVIASAYEYEDGAQCSSLHDLEDSTTFSIGCSTKHGNKVAAEDGNFTTSVQEDYRRFTLVEEDDGTSHWTQKK